MTPGLQALIRSAVTAIEGLMKQAGYEKDYDTLNALKSARKALKAAQRGSRGNRKRNRRWS